MVLHEGHRNKEQKVALIKLIWGLSVSFAGLLGLFGAANGFSALLLLGALLDIIDSVLNGLGGIITSIFFALAGMLICFCLQMPLWAGLCTGLCAEGVVGGLLSYSIRLANFIAEEKGPVIRRLKRAVRRFLESL